VRERTDVVYMHIRRETMKYLTKKRWASVRAGDAGVTAAGWGKALRAYREQLESLRPRLPEHVFAFFDRADIHDGELLHVHIRDGSRVAPLDRLPRPWIVPGDHPVRMEIAILDVYDRRAWTLRYGAIRRILVDFPSDQPLFHGDGAGFGDVGVHELTDCGDGFLRHELLFASGATLLVEFREIDVHSRERAPGAEAPVQADR